MNDILLLKGEFKHLKNNSGYGQKKLPSEKSYPLSHIDDLIFQLKDVQNFWLKKDFIRNILIDVHYIEVVAKSNRMSHIFSPIENENIVGARFSSTNEPKHIITYRFTREDLEQAIERLSICKNVIEQKFGEIEINQNVLDTINQKNNFSPDIKNYPLISCLVECFYIEKFCKERVAKKIKEHALVSIYDTGEDTIELLKNFDIHIPSDRLLDQTTLRLFSDEIEKLNNNGAYLISMAVNDFSKISKDSITPSEQKKHSIPLPHNEPTIGVIDTLFDKKAYFSDWVQFKNMISEEIEFQQKDYNHGTAVSSIIVDGPSLNPGLDDGCGRFRVRHFGVMLDNGGSTFSLIKFVKQIIRENRDIKVWNLSLGSTEEIPHNYISIEASFLDKLQNEFDIIFIVAGTNKDFHSRANMKIGAPADSINSIVVNSVTRKGVPASYTRSGPVLSFYNKPDLCYYGGDENEKINAIDSNGDATVCGTSYAAPWIARKMAYLIHVMGLNRETAKALLIDAAAGWMKKESPSTQIGYGIVPQNINDIIQCQNNEIRFILTDYCSNYETCNLGIPVPIVKNQYPFVARATLCYIPNCERNQGVDYTSTEIDMHFGRIKNQKNKDSIDAINGNPQDPLSFNEISRELKEINVRAHFRKWDNVKYVAQNANGKAHKAYDNNTWGISLKIKNRIKIKEKKQFLTKKEQENNEQQIRFAVVVTLKEIEGKNRLDEFIKKCELRNWMVHTINVQNRIDIYNKSEENVTFE